jgi:hypothetical protein
MSLVNSPSFSDSVTKFDPDGGSKPPAPTEKEDGKNIHSVLGVLIGAMVLLTFLNIYISNGQFGTVSGFTKDEQGRPLQAEIFVLGVDVFQYTDENGYFKIDSIPIGNQDLIIGYNEIGQSIEIEIPFGGEVKMGTIVFDTTIEDG